MLYVCHLTLYEEWTSNVRVYSGCLIYQNLFLIWLLYDFTIKVITGKTAPRIMEQGDSLVNLIISKLDCWQKVIV